MPLHPRNHFPTVRSVFALLICFNAGGRGGIDYMFEDALYKDFLSTLLLSNTYFELSVYHSLL